MASPGPGEAERLGEKLNLNPKFGANGANEDCTLVGASSYEKIEEGMGNNINFRISLIFFSFERTMRALSPSE